MTFDSLHTTGGRIVLPGTGYELYYSLAAESGASIPIWTSSQQALSLCLVNSPSGSGKSTFLRQLYNYVLGLKSDLVFDFRPDSIDSGTRAASFIPQHPPMVDHWKAASLLPALSEFIGCFFLPIEGEKVSQKRLGELSGGQKKKLYTCSALERLKRARSSLKFLFLDETLDGLGAAGARTCLMRLEEKWAGLGDGGPLNVILVSHLNPDELLKDKLSADKLALSVVSESSHRAKISLSGGV